MITFKPKNFSHRAEIKQQLFATLIGPNPQRPTGLITLLTLLQVKPDQLLDIKWEPTTNVAFIILPLIQKKDALRNGYLCIGCITGALDPYAGLFVYQQLDNNEHKKTISFMNYSPEDAYRHVTDFFVQYDQLKINHFGDSYSIQQ